MKNTTNYDGLSIDDIIFDGRNKAYGAYELRQSYNRRIKQGVLGALALSALLCSYQSLMALYHPVHALEHKQVVADLKNVTVEKIETIEMTKPKTPEPPKPKPAPAPKGVSDPPTVRSTAILVPTNTEHTTDSIPRNDMLAIVATGDQNKNGTTPGDKKGDPNGDLLAMNVTRPAAAPETVNTAEVMPEYPGGESAMMRDITNNIDYPDVDRVTEVQGRVVVGFIVDENGIIKDVHVMRGLSRTLNDESIRVIRKLKNFKPGSQGGHPVRVRYTLPISYRLS